MFGQTLVKAALQFVGSWVEYTAPKDTQDSFHGDFAEGSRNRVQKPVRSLPKRTCLRFRLN